ncbi:hypothetical protein [Gorillibacterium sp. sgz5001074]|uniref:hypothetical protein n=1 Tax=Gorillibacterium sp. sgz5001074 TaxID=3446695 RepID=UPI003F66D314
MKIWIPRMILITFALLLAAAVYWGYKNTSHPDSGQNTPVKNKAAARSVPHPA